MEPHELFIAITVTCVMVAYLFFIFIIIFRLKKSLNWNLLFSGAIHIATDDFQKLATKEGEPVIFYIFAWRKHYYLTTVRGTKIFTFSKDQLQFPELCEIIPVKKV